MLRVSIVVLVLLWLIVAAILSFGWMLAGSASDFIWDAKHVGVGVVLTIVCLLAIPIQIRRFFRELRVLKRLGTAPTDQRHSAL